MLAVSLLVPPPLIACSCLGSSSVCDSFSRADIVFAGRVECVEPNIDPSDPSVRRSFTARFTEEEIERLESDSSLETFRKVREIYSELLPEPARSRVAHASSREELDAILEGILKDGKKVKFRVGEAFRGTNTETVEVWTDVSDCGVSFQKGEFYLVYAY